MQKVTGDTSRHFRPTPASHLPDWTSPTPTRFPVSRRRSQWPGDTAAALRGVQWARSPRFIICSACSSPERARWSVANVAQPVAPASPETVSRFIEEWPSGTRYEIGFPLEIRAGTDQRALLGTLHSRGFTRLRIGGQTIALDGPDPALPVDGSIDVIVDRLIRGSDSPDRRADSIETAFDEGLGRCRVIAIGESRTYVRGWRCSRCGTDHIEPQPELFRYNSALGACPVCEGTGRTMELDLGRIVPDPSRTIRSGAIAPWSIPHYQKYQLMN